MKVIAFLIIVIVTKHRTYGQTQTPCEICGAGLVVTKLDVIVESTGSTCETLQQQGLDGIIPSGQCAAAPEFVFDVCGCAPASQPSTSPQSAAPTPLPSPSPITGITPSPVAFEAPTNGPSLPSANPPCSICGEGLRATILDAVVNIPGIDQVPTCQQFESTGFEGQISQDTCPLLPVLVGTLCGCAPATTAGPSSVGSPSVAPFTSTLSPASTVSPVASNPVCLICGEGLNITVFDAIVVLPGIQETPTCEEFEQIGLGGRIPVSSCAQLPDLVGPVCGCKSSTTVSTTSVPVESPVLAPSAGPGPCYVCGGEGYKITNPETTTDITGVVLTCSELEAFGLNGGIPEAECPFVYKLEFNNCGCVEDTSSGGNNTSEASILRCDDPTATNAVPNGTANVLEFMYEVLLNNTAYNPALPSILVDTLEPAIAAEIYPDLCTSRRLLLEGRRLNVVSLSDSPPDEVLPDEQCVTYPSNGDCLVVQGSMTIYTDADDSKLEAFALEKIQMYMTNKTFDELDYRVEGLRFRTTPLGGNESFSGIGGVGNESSPGSSPTNGCSTGDTSGTIGDDSGDVKEVEFFYEVLTTPETVVSAIKSILVRSLEPAISGSLLSGIFTGLCSRRQRRQRGLQGLRRLNVIGLSPKPNDDVVPSVKCVVITDPRGDTCTVIRGVFRLYAEPGTNVTEKKEASLARISASMTNGAFDNLDVRMVEIRYRGERLPSENVDGASNVRSKSVPVWGWVLIGISICLLNMIIFCCCRCQRESKDVDNDDDDNNMYGFGDMVGGGYGSPMQYNGNQDYRGSSSFQPSGAFEDDYPEPGGGFAALGFDSGSHSKSGSIGLEQPKGLQPIKMSTRSVGGYDQPPDIMNQIGNF